MRRRTILFGTLTLAAVVALVLLASVIFATCRSGSCISLGGKPTPPSLTQTATLTQSAWILTYLSVDGREQPLVPGDAPTLSFDPFDGHIYSVYGTDGCNDYFGTYTLVGNALYVSGLFHTLAACFAGGVPLSPQENAYLQALPRVERYHLDGNVLTLTSADGSVRLTFRAFRAYR
jgi:heat shock protein HslJ